MSRIAFCRICIPVFLLLATASVRAGSCIISGDLTRTSASSRENKIPLTVFDAWVSGYSDWDGSIDTNPLGLILLFK